MILFKIICIYFIMNQKCVTCKVIKSNDNFIKGNKTLKTCLECREKDKKRDRNCEHGRNKLECRLCKKEKEIELLKTMTKCSRCEVIKSNDNFIKDDKTFKTCLDCREKDKKKREKSKCEHNIQKRTCVLCNGNSRCQHLRMKSVCKECNGGSICIHKKRRSRCKECGGNEICEHKRQRSVCVICDPIGHLTQRVQSNICESLKCEKSKRSVEYLGIDIQSYKIFLQDKFIEGMTWGNYGEWHIDHIIPLQYQKPTLEQVIERLHYTNTQPLWAKDNMSKGNRFIG